MTLNFKYKQVEKFRKTPSIPITIYEDVILDSIALIDSGADFTCIPKSLAKVLGLSFDSEEETAGIGGSVKCYSSKMKIKVGSDRENYSFILPIRVVDDDSIPILLGRAKFFDKFKIIFDQKNNKVSLRHNV